MNPLVHFLLAIFPQNQGFILYCTRCQHFNAANNVHMHAHCYAYLKEPLTKMIKNSDNQRLENQNSDHDSHVDSFGHVMNGVNGLVIMIGGWVFDMDGN